MQKKIILLNPKNSDYLLSQLNLAKEKFSLLPNSLSDLAKVCVQNIIIPTSDAIWNTKNACEKLSQQIYGKYPTEIVKPNFSRTLDQLPNELTEKILNVIPLLNLGEIETLSKQHKAIIDFLLTQPENVINIISEVTSFDAMQFINSYIRTDQYQNLITRYYNKEKMSPEEIICIALTIDDINKMKSSDLEFAITDLEKNLHPDMLKNLNIMNKLIKFREIKLEDIGGQTYYLTNRLIPECQTRNNTKYINLQGADLAPSKHLAGNIAGANFKNAIFPEQAFFVKSILSVAAFGSIQDMQKELNQLVAQINQRKDPEERRLFRIRLIFNFKTNIKKLFKIASEQSNIDRLEKYIALIDILLKHPAGKRSIDQKFQDLFILRSPIKHIEQLKQKINNTLIQITQSGNRLHRP